MPGGRRRAGGFRRGVGRCRSRRPRRGAGCHRRGDPGSGSAPAPPPARVTQVPPPRPGGSVERREAFAHALAETVERGGEVFLVELRVLEGRASAALATGEGFLARWDVGGALVELLLAPEDGPWRLVSTAVASLRELEVGPWRTARSARRGSRPRGGSPHRQLADVLLAPAVAAPLVAALARRLAADRGEPAASLAQGRVSPLWRLEDHRAGPDGLLPGPCDGEGVPARTIVLLAGGHARERYLMWRDANDLFGVAGGAVRRSYREPPFPGPANLVLSPVRALLQPDLLSALGDGFYLACPAGGAFVDEGAGDSRSARPRWPSGAARPSAPTPSSSCAGRSDACSPGSPRPAPTSRAFRSTARSPRRRCSSAAWRSRRGGEQGERETGDAVRSLPCRLSPVSRSPSSRSFRIPQGAHA